MRIDTEKLITEIKPLYLEDPCKISCIAFWKIEQQVSNAETYQIIENNNVYLYAIKDNKLIFYWSNNLAEFKLPTHELQDLDFMVLHSGYYNLIKEQLKGYESSGCNPLLYDFSFDVPVVANNNYYVDEFDFNSQQDYEDAAELINSAYKGHNHKSAEVKTWTKVPAFDPSLWFWVREKGTNEPVALAINTYQESIRESYLDWIQVSPKHHGKGIGKIMVYETLNRAIPKSDIIRVTGIADEFYKRCGFVETEKWIYSVKK